MRLFIKKSSGYLAFLFFLATPTFLHAEGLAILRNLRIGDTGTDVKILQTKLNEDPDTIITLSGPGSKGQETDYFGEKTRDAVKRYQEKWKKEILVPAGLLSGTGFFGEATRNHMFSSIKRESGTIDKDVTPVPSKPIITSVYPTHAMEGTEVTLYGTGFSAKNTVYASFNKLENIPSPDGKTIKFIVQEPFPDDVVMPDFLREKFKTIQYGFYVSNERGSSNTIMFTLDLIKR